METTAVFKFNWSHFGDRRFSTLDPRPGLFWRVFSCFVPRQKATLLRSTINWKTPAGKLAFLYKFIVVRMPFKTSIFPDFSFRPPGAQELGTMKTQHLDDERIHLELKSSLVYRSKKKEERAWASEDILTGDMPVEESCSLNGRKQADDNNLIISSVASRCSGNEPALLPNGLFPPGRKC